MTHSEERNVIRQAIAGCRRFDATQVPRLASFRVRGKRPMRVLLAVVASMVSLFLSGCGPGRQQELNDRYSSYVGRPVSDAVVAFGPPTHQFDMGPTERAFQWKLEGSYRTSAVATPLYGGSVIVNPSQQRNTQCLFTFIATAPSRTAELSQWVVQRWQWNASDMTSCQ